MISTTENEKESLEAHVDLCALRYQGLDHRLIILEGKLDKIEEKLDNFQKEITWMLIKSGATTILLLLAAIGAAFKIVAA